MQLRCFPGSSQSAKLAFTSGNRSMKSADTVSPIEKRPGFPSVAGVLTIEKAAAV